MIYLLLFFLAKHNYESALNGEGRELVVRKDCYDKHEWHSSNVNAYASSSISRWLNNTYKNLLSAYVQTLIGITKFYYTPGNGKWNVGTLERSVFLLSLTELDKEPTSSGVCNVEGSALPIASSLQIAHLNGGAFNQWSRSPYTDRTTYAWWVTSDGHINYDVCLYNNGSRPAFTLPSDAIVDENLNLMET